MEYPIHVNAVRFHDVVIDSETMTLYSGQSKLLSIARKDIRRIYLRHGFQSERPFAEVLFGAAIIGLGIYFVSHFLLVARLEGIIYDLGCLSPLLLPVGGWFIVDGLRMRLYFEVILDNDQRKFPLGKNPDDNELETFIEIASQLGYSIDATNLDTNIMLTRERK